MIDFNITFPCSKMLLGHIAIQVVNKSTKNLLTLSLKGKISPSMGIRTSDLQCWKRLIYQQTHNHCLLLLLE